MPRRGRGRKDKDEDEDEDEKEAEEEPEGDEEAQGRFFEFGGQCADGYFCGGGRFEEEGSKRSGNWKFVGKNKGGYERVQVFEHVGDGNGSYAVEAEASSEGWCGCGCDRKAQPCCLGLLVVALLAAGGYVLVMGQTPALSAAVPPFDCFASQGLTEEKRSYCCARHNLYCRPQPRYLCSGAMAGPREAWGEEQKVWCCENDRVGCEGLPRAAVPQRPVCGPSCTHPVCRLSCRTESAEPLPFDCEAGLRHWERGWSEEKKEWCCARYGKTCSPGSRPASPPPERPAEAAFDCRVGLDRWRREWSSEKQAHCCRVEGLGCPESGVAGEPPRPTEAAPAKFDCTAGLEHLERGWSDAKKDYCCSERGIGCAVPSWSGQTPPRAPTESRPVRRESASKYDCDADFPAWESSWSVEQKAWCCEREGKGCPPARSGCEPTATGPARTAYA